MVKIHLANFVVILRNPPRQIAVWGCLWFWRGSGDPHILQNQILSSSIFFIQQTPSHEKRPKILDVFSPFPQVRPFHLSQLQDCSRFQGNPQESQCCSCLSHADVSSCGQGSALRLLLWFSRSCWHKLPISLYKTQPLFLFFLFEMVIANSMDVSKLWDTGAATISCYKAYAKLIQ